MLVNKTVAENNAELIPVDSEHSAIFQALKAGDKKDVKRIILTASGGPFREYPQDKFDDITVEQALSHPTWNMGRKITIDSATLMNKALEIIEAYYLFGLSADKINVVIHPQSIVHSMVEFVDGSVIAQLSNPDMRLPIQFALFYPGRSELDTANLDFNRTQKLDFIPPDFEKFLSLNLAYKSLKIGGTAPAVLNGANEAAVALFLENRIKFTEIFSIVEQSLDHTEFSKADSIESIIEADNIGRKTAINYLNSLK
jgi:1-deoxy-D-xylulose-5-phosphate reductoisomerase